MGGRARDGTIIDGSAIKNGMISYSTKKFQELISTYKYRVTNLEEFMFAFKSTKLVWGNTELIAFIERIALENDVEDLGSTRTKKSIGVTLLNFLYEAGFLVGESSSPTLPFVANYISSYHQIINSSTIGIHPAYHRELQTGYQDYQLREFTNQMKLTT
jgi:hypothetical protein